MNPEELSTLTVEYVNKSSTQIHNSTNEYIITVKFRLSDTVASFLSHLSASYNGLRSCSQGKELYLILSKGKMKRLDQNKQSTLEFHGIKNNDHLVLRGFRPISRRHYMYLLRVIDPNDQPIHVYVTNTTDMNALKHKLQNETGVHASEITLYCNDKAIPKNSLTTVEFYGGKSSKKVLKMRLTSAQEQAVVKPVMTKESQASPESNEQQEKIQFDNSRSSLKTGVERDGPYNVPQGRSHPHPSVRSRATVLQSEPCTRKVSKVPLTHHCYNRDEYLSRVTPKPISEEGFVEISKEKFEWEQLAIRLGISDGDRQCIQHDYIRLEKIKLHILLRWKEKNGEMATWRSLLIAVFEEENIKLADKIIELARKRKNSDNTSPSPEMLLSDEKPVNKRPRCLDQ